MTREERKKEAEALIQASASEARKRPERRKQISRKDVAQNKSVQLMNRLRLEKMLTPLETGDSYNQLLIRHNLEIISKPRINLNKPQNIVDRFSWYLRLCDKNNMKPSLSGFAVALGENRSELHKMKEGLIPIHPESRRVLLQIWGMLESLMTDAMQDNKINPVVGIFLSKNWYGYRDQQEQVIIPKDSFGTSETTEDIRARYLEDLPAPELPTPDGDRKQIDSAEDLKPISEE